MAPHPVSCPMRPLVRCILYGLHLRLSETAAYRVQTCAQVFFHERASGFLVLTDKIDTRAAVSNVLGSLSGSIARASQGCFTVDGVPTRSIGCHRDITAVKSYSRNERQHCARPGSWLTPAPAIPARTTTAAVGEQHSIHDGCILLSPLISIQRLVVIMINAQPTGSIRALSKSRDPQLADRDCHTP
jgi:hypothetical protein